MSVSQSLCCQQEVAFHSSSAVINRNTVWRQRTRKLYMEANRSLDSLGTEATL